VITAGGTIVAACEKAITEAIGTSTVAASPAPAGRLSLGTNVEAWTWVKRIKVGVSEGECERVLLHVNGQEFQAQPQGDSFIADVQLAEGENQVTAACIQQGGEETRSEPVTYTGRLRQVPTAVIRISLKDGQILFDGSESLPTEGTEAAIVEYLWSARESNPSPLQIQDGNLNGEINSQSISILPPEVDGEYYVRLRVKDQEGREDTSTIYFVIEEGQPRIPNYDMENPEWVETAIVYGIVPFLFGSPAFKAIGERLDGNQYHMVGTDQHASS
jgi:hypothetical protein